MKLLIIYHSGLADDAKHIFNEYARQGVDVTMIVPKKWFEFPWLFGAIKKANPDVIHVFDEYSSLVLFETAIVRNILYGKKVPLFSLSFQNLPLTPPFVFTSPVAFIKRIAYKVLLPFVIWYHKKNVTGIVGGAKEALHVLKNLGVTSPMKFVFWGVNLSLFFPKNQSASREKLGIPKEIKLLGYFGNIMKEKGLGNLVKAVKELGDWHLLLVGNGRYKEELKKLIISLSIQDRVYFYGRVALSDLNDYYNCLDTYVLPTYTAPNCKEQYGRVLVEAMACKLPIIGSTCGAIPDVLEGYPAHVIFNEYSLPDLIEAIKKVEALQLPEDFHTTNFLQRFSVENFVLENIKFYHEFIR